MEFSPDTPLVDVPGFDSLSVRAKNVCRSGRINTIGQLSRLTDVDLLRLPNCGHKTIFELRSLYVPSTTDADSNGAIKSTDRTLRTAYNTALSSLNLPEGNSFEQFVASYSSDTTFIRICIASAPRLFSDLSEEPFARDVTLRHTLLDFLRALAGQPFLLPDECEGLEKTASLLATHLPDFAMADTYFALPAAVRSCIGTFYRSHFANLSVRSQNAFRHFTNLDDLVPVLFGLDGYNPRSNRNCGRKSAQEIASFITEMKELLMRLLDTISSGSEDDVLHILSVRYTEIYTFLSIEEAMQVASFVLRTDRLPSLYILARYIAKSNNRNARVFDGIYGITAPHQPRTMSELSEELGLSRERVRQLSLGQLALPPDLEPMRQEALRYVTSSVISSADPMWQAVAAENMLDGMPPHALLGLIRALESDLEVVTLSNSELSYLVSRPLLSGISLAQCVVEVNKLVRMRRSEPGTVNVALILRRSRTNGDLHPDVDRLATIIIDHFAPLDNVTVVGPATIYVAANFVDRRAAIADILERRGEPMSIEEIFETFNSMYPGYPVRNIASMRAFIFQCDNILAVGKSGRYVLDSWTDRFHGTILQFVTALLTEASEPLSLDVISERTREVFPRTTPNSIATIISIDPEKRITRFANSYFGLTDRNYPGWEDRLRGPLQRRPFAERFEQFKEFVTRNASLPTSASDAEGVTLRRWLSNVQAGRIAVTPGEMAALEAFLDTTRHMPQNADEARFQSRCKDMLRYVDEHNAMPTFHTDRKLYQWFHLARKSLAEWNDNRTAFYDRLLEELRTRGYDV